MNYEEIKNSIEQDLIRQGFVKQGHCLIKIDIRQHQIVINGVPSVQEEKQEVEFRYIGEGSIDERPAVGYSLYINNCNVTDLWCTNLEDFKYLLQKL